MLKQTSIISVCSHWGINKSPEVLTNAEREELLIRVEESLPTCRACSLGKIRSPKDQMRLYLGNPSSQVLLMGKAPGYYEAKGGSLFAGRSGNELRWLMRHANIDFDEVYITNVCHCRTSDTSSSLKTKDIKKCKKWTDIQMHIVRPKIILMMGSPAIYAITGSKMTLNEARSKEVFEKDGIKLIATFHPAFYTRSTVEVEDRNKEEGLKDWLLLRKTMDEVL